jgi:hypothetical protein
MTFLVPSNEMVDLIISDISGAQKIRLEKVEMQQKAASHIK